MPVKLADCSRAIWLRLRYALLKLTVLAQIIPRQYLGDLHGVQRRALAHIVG